MKVLTFGEIMLRLTPPGKERFFQSSLLEASFGGSEANAAAALINFGVPASFLTVLPQGPIADACLRQLWSFGIDTSPILRGKGRMGLYYLEEGVNQLPGRVIYDRADSAMALASPGDVDWEAALQDITWFHFSGITPAISRSAFDLTLQALQEAKKRDITVSCDLNYRSNLWQYGLEAADAMKQLMPYVDVVMAADDELRICLGVSPKLPKNADYDTTYRTAGQQVMEAYPHLKLLTVITRQVYSAERCDWSACLYDGRELWVSRSYDIRNILENSGGGDCFAGALIYGLSHYDKPQMALEFATAASCLKYSVRGDMSRLDAALVEKVMHTSGSTLQR